ncbi:MAG: hypothetical protein ACJAYO_000254 [Thalassolituus oleivorans]
MIAALVILLVINMKKIYSDQGGRYICEYYIDGDLAYVSKPSNTRYEAELEVDMWRIWLDTLPLGQFSSIYYIVEIPETWSGSSNEKNILMGLRVKIGRTKNIETRLSNLKTGSSGELIVLALEPGDSTREREIHKKFSSCRRQGEWFVLTAPLLEHIRSIFFKYKALPPGHLEKVRSVFTRAVLFNKVRDFLGHPPELVNPSLEEDWSDVSSVLIDLVYGPRKRDGNY